VFLAHTFPEKNFLTRLGLSSLVPILRQCWIHHCCWSWDCDTKFCCGCLHYLILAVGVTCWNYLSNLIVSLSTVRMLKCV